MITVFLAHGASGTAASMTPHVSGLERRGIRARAVSLPRGRADSAVATYRAAAPPSADAVIGGHSFGGRVASLLAAEVAYRGLVLLSYPLHPPGARDRWEVRTDHWPRIDCPVLLISGDRDPFASLPLLARAVERLRDPELVIMPGLGHVLGPVLDDVLDRLAAWVAAITP